MTTTRTLPHTDVDPDGLPRKALLAALRRVKRGDFSTRLPEDLPGLDGKIADAFNDIVELNDNLTQELVSLGSSFRVEGRTKRRISRRGARGGWGTCVNAVNSMVGELTRHADEMARVVTAVSKGDLTQTIDAEGDGGNPLRGDFLRHARRVNGMVEQLAAFGSEVTRVAREVGVEGKLGAQARVKGVSGTWKELNDNVNQMADNLTNQVRDIAQVTTAVAQGDLTRKITVEVRGEMAELKNTINTMVDQLGSFADEVTRVAREVGTEGVLGGQAEVKGVAGTWRELTENVNSMASNLTNQVRNIATVTTAVANGDLGKKITVEVKGEMLALKNTINTMVDQLGSFADEVTRVAREVGTEGVLGGEADVKGVSGIWRDLTENVNSMANNLTNQVRNIAEVATAIAEGDLSRKITVDAKGEILTLKDTINAMVDRLQTFQSEVTRVAREVGTEGVLGGQAHLKNLSGVWKELSDNVNTMANNLTNQVRNIAEVTTAVANGDLSRKITVEVRGEILQLKNTINQMVDSLNAFASEVTRMARDVGTEGTLGGQAMVRDVSGIWKELTDNVNQMAANLTSQVRNIAEVASAVAAGDLSKKITVDAKGEILDLKDTVNTMVDQLSAFGAEVTRVASTVGVEGRLGEQAQVEGVRGLWKALTDNVNLMASNLTNQVRDIADVTTAVASGDLTRKITVDAKGEIAELKDTINIMVDQLSSFSVEVIRLARDVGLEGKLGGQADVRGLAGTWRDLADNVNLMASNLTDQVRSISQVATGIAQGDLSATIVVDASGEILDLKNTINTMVAQLRSFAGEVTRVASDVGTEGKLGGQAEVEGVAGTWRVLTNNVNLMASNLTNQVRDIAQVTTAVAQGDLSKKITVEVRGEMLELKNTINTMVDQLSSFAEQVTRVARDVGVEGKLGGQADVRGVAGTWRELTDNVNLMASNLTNQVRDIAQVTTAVAQGDLSKKITVEVRGEMLELKNTINTMVDQLGSFSDEVTRVAREVGTEGILGGQAEVRGVSGIWQQLSENVNTMARNLTEQVRGIAGVVTAVANGDLKRQLTLQARGEIATLAETINNMILTLSTFADQVTNVARDVGVEGKLGGQADVPGAAGIWRDLTDNVNELAGNLTNQVRAIAGVATAVTKGDLTQTITVEARGEVALLKDTINQMIATLAGTTRVNQEQDWLKTNLTKFTRMVQGERDLTTVARLVMSELAAVIGAQHGMFYVVDASERDDPLRLYASYARTPRKAIGDSFRFGEGLVGQCALERTRILLTDVPTDYIPITSGLGEARPTNVVVVPILFEGETKGVVELAAFEAFTATKLSFLEQLFESLGIVIASLEANKRTEELLKQSQRLAVELQVQQDELQQTNEELEEKARQVTEQKVEVERKNREVEAAKAALEEKAEQLALTSRYKNQFLANMSHELRTPLNSLLILSRQLADNTRGNLSEKQVEFADTIHAAGVDLLGLIEEVLDLAKIESGTMAIEMGDVVLSELREYLERAFRQLADDKNIALEIEMDPELPETIRTDDKRLQQVLRNLLANAFKFTDEGRVKVLMAPAREGWSAGTDSLDRAPSVVAFSVQDTGIGIPPDRRSLIFEAFQQVDGGTSRGHGGTGLGLSISREIASLLGGEIRVTSTLGEGSTFTLWLPHAPAQPQDAELARESHASTDPHATRSTTEPPLLILGSDEVCAGRVGAAATKRGYRPVVVARVQAGVSQALRATPAAVVVDVTACEVRGWVALDRFKRDLRLRQIPLCAITHPQDVTRARRRGALVAIPAPPHDGAILDALERVAERSSRSPRHVLLVDTDERRREELADLLGVDGLNVELVDEPEEAVDRLERAAADCLVLGPHLCAAAVEEVVGRLGRESSWRHGPVLVDLSLGTDDDDPPRLEAPDDLLVVEVGSDAHLLDEASRALHRPEGMLTARGRRLLQDLRERDPLLSERKILLVDDDIRNIFAIASLLERHGVDVTPAESGADALRLLSEQADIDLVLMDIMMPGMDGFTAMRRIRAMPDRRDLPIVALTAKAMQGDREACLDAGASDYVSKPVDPDHLVSVLRVWLER